MELFCEVYTPAPPPSVLDKMLTLLAQSGLAYEPCDVTVCLRDSAGDEFACGGLRANVLMCIAVDERLRGEGLTARDGTALREQGVLRSHSSLLVFTSPKY